MAPPLCPRVPRRRPSSSCSPEKNTPKQYRRRSVKKGWRAEPSRREAEATGEATTYSGSSGTVGPDTVTFQTSRVGRADARTNGAEGREGSPLTTSWQTPGSIGHKKLVLLLRKELQWRWLATAAASKGARLALLLRCSVAPDLLLLLRQLGRPHPPPPSLLVSSSLSLAAIGWLVP